MIKLYKIVAYRNGNYITLFHGVNGSKILPLYTWIEAESKLGRDGSGVKWYDTGFHCLPNLIDSYAYLYNFKDDENKYILTCYCDGIWEKKASSKFTKIYLCKRIYLVEE